MSHPTHFRYKPDADQFCLDGGFECPIFWKAAHFACLDSVVNWKIFSQEYWEEFRQMYSIRECLELFKSYPPGYRGRGRRGELLGFYSEDFCTGFCSQDCSFAAGNEFVLNS